MKGSRTLIWKANFVPQLSRWETCHFSHSLCQPWDTPSRLTSVLYTPYIRKMKRPCKRKWREKAVNANHFSSRNTWNQLSWEQTKEDTLHQGQFIYLFFNVRSCTLSIYKITYQHITYSPCAIHFFRLQQVGKICYSLQQGRKKSLILKYKRAKRINLKG